ncbi:hypothetical protein Tco_0878485 [Tanacetum coccineum]|uniref:Retrovirus-related Pol polyprotein from transposon TNT 1-94 n=1 Tax=Tanacetum coccineum TaxID=301880 RepID=A0ABQ5C3W6_9ASTR
MSEKAKDPEAVEKKISHKPIDYEKLNRLFDDFWKRFTLQQELSAEQAFWHRISNPTIESSYTPPVKMEVPSELPKVSLVNASLKKLKLHLAQLDSVVKKRITPNACIEGEWGFEHTKASSADKQCLEIAKKEILLENDRLLHQIVSQDVLLTVMNSMSLNASIQLNQEIFQKDESCHNQNALEIPEYFEMNDLKAQLQDKDTTICKLKEIMKSMREKSKEENINYDFCEIQTKNVELEHSVAKLLYENERLCKEINHVKQVFKDQFDSINQTRVSTKEQCDSLIDKLNLKSAQNEDLKAQIQDKDFVITSLKNDLRKLKGKESVVSATHIPFVTTIVPGMFKLDLDPLAPKLLQNREAHIAYLKNTQEQAYIIRGIVEQAKAKQPLDNEKPDLSYLHVFGALCYPTNDSETLGKLQAKAGYRAILPLVMKPKKESLFTFRTRASLKCNPCNTPVQDSSQNPTPSAWCVPPSRKEWDLVFQPVFDEFFCPPDSVAFPVPVVEAPALVESTGSLPQTLVDQNVSTYGCKNAFLNGNFRREEVYVSQMDGFVDQDNLSIMYHFIKEQVENGVVELYFVSTEYQLADIFSKALRSRRIKFLIDKLEMRSFTPKTLKQLADEAKE